MNAFEIQNREIDVRLKLTEKRIRPEKGKKQTAFVEIFLGVVCALMSFFIYLIIERTVG